MKRKVLCDCILPICISVMCTGTSTDAEELVTLLIAAGLFTVALDVSQMFSFPPTPVLEGLAARWVNFIGVELLSPSPYSNCIVHHTVSVYNS